MDKNGKQKKPSNYEKLQKLDKQVQSSKPTKKDERPKSFNGNESRKRRSPSPRNYDDRRFKSARRSDNYRKSNKVPEVVEEFDYSIPDRSYGDLYCKACDSHMNSEHMWEAHIQGKRHQKHVKKGETDLKYETLKEEPIFQPELKKIKEPLIGLQHCCEIQRLEGKPIYQCFLCSANLPNGQGLIEHVLGLKHRMTYLKDHDPVKHDLIVKADLKKGMIEPVVEDCIRLHHDKHGQGLMQVKAEKYKPPAPPYQSYKKPFNENHDLAKRDYGRSNYPDNRDYDRDRRQEPERERGYPGDDPYKSFPSEPAYHKSDSLYDRERFYKRADSPTRQRRSLTPPQKTYDASSHQTNATYSHQSSSSWMPVKEAQPKEDLRLVLEQRKMQDMNRTQTASSKSNVLESLMGIIDSMPSMLFLELVLHRVENMNPTDLELDMLTKIGNHMISIVMARKLKHLSPDLLNKYQQSLTTLSIPEAPAARRVVETSSNPTNLNNLMDLISQLKSSQPSSTTTGNFLGQSSGLQYNDQVISFKGDEPAFMTQTPGSFYNSWGSTSGPSTQYESSGIPGLTLSSANEADSSAQSSYYQAISQGLVSTQNTAPTWSFAGNQY